MAVEHPIQTRLRVKFDPLALEAAMQIDRLEAEVEELHKINRNIDHDLQSTRRLWDQQVAALQATVEAWKEAATRHLGEVAALKAERDSIKQTMLNMREQREEYADQRDAAFALLESCRSFIAVSDPVEPDTLWAQARTLTDRIDALLSPQEQGQP